MKLYTYSVFLMGIFIFLMAHLSSCSRDAGPIETSRSYHEFTTLKKDTDERLLVLMDSLQRFEEKRPFMDSIAGKYGYPLWEHAVLGYQNGGLTVLAPLVKKGAQKVSGLIALRNEGQFRARFFDAEKPDKYGFGTDGKKANARTVFITADLFNQRAFDHDPAAINDPCLMSSIERSYIANVRLADGEKKLTLTAREMVGYVETCYYTMVCIGDGSGNCIGEVTVHKDCVLSSIWIDENDGGADGYYPVSEGPYSLGEGAGPGTDGQGAPYDCNVDGEEGYLGEGLAVLPPSKPITNVVKYVSCFSLKDGAIISFFADQPLAGSSDAFSMKEKVGHTFVTIEQFVGGRIVRRALGFHPSDAVSPFLTKSSESQLGDDSNEPYDVRLDVSVTPEVLGKVLGLIQNYNPVYHLENYNCTNFVLDIADECGLQISRTKGSWVVGSGLNPGNFGEDLKKIRGAVVGQGKSAENSGTCN